MTIEEIFHENIEVEAEFTDNIDVSKDNAQILQELKKDVNRLRAKYDEYLKWDGLLTLWWSDLWIAEVNKNGGVTIPKHVRERYLINYETELDVVISGSKESAIGGHEFKAIVTASNVITIPSDLRHKYGLERGDKIGVRVRKSSWEYTEKIEEIENLSLVATKRWELNDDNKLSRETEVKKVELIEKTESNKNLLSVFSTIERGKEYAHNYINDEEEEESIRLFDDIPDIISIPPTTFIELTDKRRVHITPTHTREGTRWDFVVFIEGERGPVKYLTIDEVEYSDFKDINLPDRLWERFIRVREILNEDVKVRGNLRQETKKRSFIELERLTDEMP